MEKLLIVLASQKPVPAVRNGAIEVRVENVLRYNENHPLYDITVISVYDKAAFFESKKYKHSSFQYIKTPHWQKRVYFYLKAIARRLSFTNISLPRELYHYKYFNRIRKQKDKFDKILIENVVPLVEKTATMTNALVYIHLGSDGLNNRTPRAREIAESLERILVVSDYIGSRVKGIPGPASEKVIKIEQGIESSLFTKEPAQNREELRRSLGISTEDVVYEFHGRVTPDKGVKELLLAFSALAYDNVKLMIIGSKSSWTMGDDYLNELSSLATDLQDRVIFTGEISHDQIGDYLHAADVAVLPPLWEEPASNAILESMVAGLPLITTNSGGNAEYCEGEASYILSRDANLVNNITAVMEDLYLNPAKRAEKGRKAKEFGMKFTAENHAEQVLRALSN